MRAAPIGAAAIVGSHLCPASLDGDDEFVGTDTVSEVFNTCYETLAGATPGGSLWLPGQQARVRTVVLPHMPACISPMPDLLTSCGPVLQMRQERFAVVHTLRHRRCTPAPGRRPARRLLLLDRLARRPAHRYLAVSPREARKVVQWRLAAAGSIVVPTAVRLDEIPARPDPWVRREFGIPQEMPVVHTTGRFYWQRAPLDHLRMAARVRQERPARPSRMWSRR